MGVCAGMATIPPIPADTAMLNLDEVALEEAEASRCQRQIAAGIKGTRYRPLPCPPVLAAARSEHGGYLVSDCPRRCIGTVAQVGTQSTIEVWGRHASSRLSSARLRHSRHSLPHSFPDGNSKLTSSTSQSTGRGSRVKSRRSAGIAPTLCRRLSDEAESDSLY